jgi:hypothetical protein
MLFHMWRLTTTQLISSMYGMRVWYVCMARYYGVLVCCAQVSAYGIPR